MILNTLFSVAFKNEIGKYEIKDTTIFEIKDINFLFDFFNIQLVDGSLMVNFKCPICEKWHGFTYQAVDLFKQELIISGCKTLGVPVVFIGTRGKIENITKRYNQINGSMYAAFWFIVRYCYILKVNINKILDFFRF